MAPGRPGRPRKQHNNPSVPEPEPTPAHAAGKIAELGNIIAQLQEANGQPRGTANLTLQDLSAYEQPQYQGSGQDAMEEQPPPAAEDGEEVDGDVIQLQREELPFAKLSKKRRLDDRQEDATRVQWDETQPSQAVEQPEPSQDEGFQTAVAAPREMELRRQRAAGMQRRQQAPQQAPEANMSSNIFENDPGAVITASTHPDEAYTDGNDAEEEEAASEQVDASNADSEAPETARQQLSKKNKKTGGRKSKPQTEAAPSTPPEPLPDLSPSQAYSTVNRQARQYSTVQQQNGQKGPQRRIPWSPEEIDRLMLLIERHGTSWALIKRQDMALNKPDGLMVTRDQYALKDKARNMKCDYLS